MKKLRSSSSSYSLPVSYLILMINIYMLLNTTKAKGFDPLIQLPTSLPPRNRSKDVHDRVLHISDFGAKGDGKTDDTKTFKAVWKLGCSLPSKVVIVIPAGKSYLVRPINFAGPCRSKLTLRILGTIVAPKDPNVWDAFDPHKWLYFNEVKHLSVVGGGVINGMGQEWWARSCKINATNVEISSFTVFVGASMSRCSNVQAMTFHRCKNLEVRNITVLNSQRMHMVFAACRRVTAAHLKILAPADSPNTDGIHISATTHVQIRDSVIGTGDDCISIVTNSSAIQIANISCGPGHGISIGSLGKSKSWAQVHDVSVDGVSISNTQNGVRIKTWQGGGGFVSKISFQNIWMENVSNPIIIDQYYCDSPFPCKNQTSAIAIETVSFLGIKGTSATEQAITFTCSDACPCQNLFLEDIELLSTSGKLSKSFCWEAYGSSSGLVYPPPCFPCSEDVIQMKILPSNIQTS